MSRCQATFAFFLLRWPSACSVAFWPLKAKPLLPSKQILITKHKSPLWIKGRKTRSHLVQNSPPLSLCIQKRGFHFLKAPKGSIQHFSTKAPAVGISHLFALSSFRSLMLAPFLLTLQSNFLLCVHKTAQKSGSMASDGSQASRGPRKWSYPLQQIPLILTYFSIWSQAMRKTRTVCSLSQTISSWLQRMLVGTEATQFQNQHFLSPLALRYDILFLLDRKSRLRPGF